jgi:hypothetical protein
MAAATGSAPTLIGLDAVWVRVSSRRTVPS